MKKSILTASILFLCLPIFSQNAILMSTTATPPTGTSATIMRQVSARIGIGTSTPSSIFTITKAESFGSQGDTYSGQSAGIRLETRNLMNQWRYWTIFGGNDFTINNVTNTPGSTPLRISLNGTIDLSDKVNINVQETGVAGGDKKIGFLVNNDNRQIFWSNFSNSTGDILTIPLEFVFDKKASGATDVSIMKLMPSGQVRIGNSNTVYDNFTSGNATNINNTARLVVDGSAVARGFIATQQNWADHVFYNPANNPSLAEEEQSILKNCTLVGVPSEKEAVKGLNLADTDALLLEKIEQLYLHVIDLKKEVEDLKNKNQILTHQLNSK